MFKTELLTRSDWLKLALFILAFGGAIFGGLYWLVRATAPSSL